MRCAFPAAAALPREGRLILMNAGTYGTTGDPVDAAARGHRRRDRRGLGAFAAALKATA
jgi:hypothetical protein